MAQKLAYEEAGRRKQAHFAHELSDIIDTLAIQSLMNDFYQLTGIGMTIVDMEGRVLVATGWQDICTQFHRVHPETSRNCLESDTILSDGIAPGTFKLYRCKNNMWDVATPISVAGQRLGNLFLGQFFFTDETPDVELFRDQARRYGFDEKAYLEAFERTPRWDRETINTVMTFYAKLAQLISTLSFSNRQLSQILAERDGIVASLQTNEEKYRLLFETINDGIFVHTLEEDGRPGRFLAVNDIACKRLGYSREELLALSPLDIGDSYEKADPAEIGQQLLIQGQALFQTIHKAKDGRRIPVESHVRLFDYCGQRAVLSIARDISARKETEQEMRKLAEAIKQASEGIAVTEKDGKIVYINPAFEQITGYAAAEALGKFPRILKSGQQDQVFYQHLWDTILTGQRWTGRMTNQRKDGKLYTAECSISPVKNPDQDIVNFIWMTRDISKEMQLEQRIVQAQKMEAIGALAGGIAHDFNNILFPIMGYAELLLDDIPADDPKHDSVQGIFQAARRAGELVKQILAFSRQSKTERHAIRLQPIIKEALKLARATIPANIQITSDIMLDCGPVAADSTQVHQILMNLITNAYHAVEDVGGAIHIALKEVALQLDDPAFLTMAAGKYACLTVSDSGMGIDKAIISKIFEPYFTTKTQGKGTGLGLATVHGIAREHGGDVRVYSEYGQGATFCVYLPLLESRPADASVPLPLKHPTGSEKIMLVDDEESIVRLERLILERLGYHITAYTDSLQALDAFSASPQQFDLVITDMTMPHLTGDQLALELIAMRPTIPIIICTGFHEKMSQERAKSIGIKGYLMKPVVTGELAVMVRQVLDDLSPL